MRNVRNVIASFVARQDGVTAVEFSILLPMLLILFLGGFAVAQTIAISRKVTITTRALADLTSQYKTMASSDITTVMNASTQILAPFNVSPLSIRLTEIQLDPTGLIATITFSKTSGSGFTPYKTGSSFLNLPGNLPATPNAAYILAETTYPYQLMGSISIRYVPTITLGDSIYMLPRLAQSVAYTGT